MLCVLSSFAPHQMRIADMVQSNIPTVHDPALQQMGQARMVSSPGGLPTPQTMGADTNRFASNVCIMGWGAPGWVPGATVGLVHARQRLVWTEDGEVPNCPTATQASVPRVAHASVKRGRKEGVEEPRWSQVRLAAFSRCRWGRGRVCLRPAVSACRPPDPACQQGRGRGRAPPKRGGAHAPPPTVFSWTHVRMHPCIREMITVCADTSASAFATEKPGLPCPALSTTVANQGNGLERPSERGVCSCRCGIERPEDHVRTSRNDELEHRIQTVYMC